MIGLAIASVSCGDATGGADHAPRFVWLSGTPAADTIVAQDTVVVRLQGGDGRPRARESIVFENTGTQAHGEPFVILYEVDGRAYDRYADSTDADGQALVGVSRGTISGTAWLRVRAPALHLVDSVPLVIHAGEPAGIRLSPSDTALHVSATLTIEASVVDRFDNARPEPVTFSAESAAVVVSSGIGSASVTGLAFGRASILASGAGHTNRTWVSVVPVGSIAFYIQAPTTGDSTGIGVISTDGSAYTPLYASPFDYASDRPLDWAPDGQSLVFHVGTNSAPHRLYQITFDGHVEPLIPQVIGGYPQMYPRHGVDGWIYFTMQTEWHTGTDELWRVQANGTTPHRVGPPAATYQSDTYAAPAPDGQRVWFSTDRPGGGDPIKMAVLHVDSGTVTLLGFDGIGAVWSPQGDRLAFINPAGAVVVAAPDGSAQQVVTRGNGRYKPYLDWSPDGKWIVASWRPTGSWSGGTDLIEPDLQLTIPLPFATQWLHPAWKP